MLLGCGLRRREVAELRTDYIQQREEHWVIADLVGKAAHIRTVPVPDWVKSAVDMWAKSRGPTVPLRQPEGLGLGRGHHGEGDLARCEGRCERRRDSQVVAP